LSTGKGELEGDVGAGEKADDAPEHGGDDEEANDALVIAATPRDQDGAVTTAAIVVLPSGPRQRRRRGRSLEAPCDGLVQRSRTPETLIHVNPRPERLHYETLEIASPEGLMGNVSRCRCPGDNVSKGQRATF
jgi:hypothetical protein